MGGGWDGSLPPGLGPNVPEKWSWRGAEQREGALDNAITLSFVDRSPIRRGGAAADALRETVELACPAEEAGYARYWVAEHHNTPAFAGDGEVEQ